MCRRGPRREGDGYVAIDVKSGTGEESAGEDEDGWLLTREIASTPAAASVCKLCVWDSACRSEMKAADDLSLLPELGRARRDALLASLSLQLQE